MKTYKIINNARDGLLIENYMTAEAALEWINSVLKRDFKTIDEAVTKTIKSFCSVREA